MGLVLFFLTLSGSNAPVFCFLLVLKTILPACLAVDGGHETECWPLEFGQKGDLPHPGMAHMTSSAWFSILLSMLPLPRWAEDGGP